MKGRPGEGAPDRNRTEPVEASRSAARPQVHDGLCDWCLDPLGDQAVELNGGIGHPRCAEWVWHAIEGADALPWRPQRQWFRQDPLIPFLERLGREAARLGIDPHKLAAAVERASR
jgi:hypothetical protein